MPGMIKYDCIERICDTEVVRDVFSGRGERRTTFNKTEIGDCGACCIFFLKLCMSCGTQ